VSTEDELGEGNQNGTFKTFDKAVIALAMLPVILV